MSFSRSVLAGPNLDDRHGACSAAASWRDVEITIALPQHPERVFELQRPFRGVVRTCLNFNGSSAASRWRRLRGARTGEVLDVAQPLQRQRRHRLLRGAGGGAGRYRCLLALARSLRGSVSAVLHRPSEGEFELLITDPFAKQESHQSPDVVHTFK
jgi:hypothetical protein